jgi:hypothetical protein
MNIEIPIGLREKNLLETLRIKMKNGRYKILFRYMAKFLLESGGEISSGTLKNISGYTDNETCSVFLSFLSSCEILSRQQKGKGFIYKIKNKAEFSRILSNIETEETKPIEVNEEVILDGRKPNKRKP